MKIVHISQGRVTEIIPEYAIPVVDWYGKDFADNCIEAPDEVMPNWRYENGEFTQDEGYITDPHTTVETLQAENKLLKAQLQAQTERSDFLEDCIAEMATVVYGGV